jgi:lysozyme family protein
MVPQTYDEAMRRVLADEGGYCNDAADPGGPTKYGITIIDVRKYLNPNATAADVKALTVAEAMEVYRKHYAKPSRYDELPAGVDYSVLDYGINSGIGRSGKVLRRVVGLPDNTSAITDEVLSAVAKRDPKSIVIAINDERLRFLQSLRIWPNFGKGWGRRVAGVKSTSLHMSGVAVSPAPLPLPAPGKGTVPEPTVIKKTIKVGAPATATVSGVSLWDWVAAHPFPSILIAVGVIAAAVFAIHAVNRWHKAKQEAPTPGLVPVPEIHTA